ncbi:MAG: filamentous hemagglutinin N-terminal domain-containing protein [Selenomonas sp.]|nr:filamentous hemagglutinin N-terminal domain-containing protein [Selenomonas sp.]
MMASYKLHKLKKSIAIALLGMAIASPVALVEAADMPTGGTVVTGADNLTGFAANPASGATIASTGDALINWASFDIGAGNILNFNTAAGTVLLNQVTGADMSYINGTLNDLGSGHLILANPHGIFVGSTGVINANYLTLSTMQNLDVTGFNKLISGGWGPEITTNDGFVAFGGESADKHATVNVNYYLGVLASDIMIEDYVAINTNHSTIDLTAVTKGQYSLLMGTAGFYSNGVQTTSSSNIVKVGNNTSLNADGNSYNQLHILSSSVKLGDYASLNTGSDADRASVRVEAVATKNDSATSASEMYTASTDNVIYMGLTNFSNGSFKLIGGDLQGETSSFSEKFTKISGGTPTPPTPPTPTPGSEEQAKAGIQVQNLLDSTLRQQDNVTSAKQSDGNNPVVITNDAASGENSGGVRIENWGISVQEAQQNHNKAVKRLASLSQNKASQTEIEQAKAEFFKANDVLEASKERDAFLSAKEAAIKEAQEKLDQARKEGFDAYSALLKARNDLSNAEEKAEQAARDYLLALKSGDKDTIAAFKEELQKANDALLEAKRNEEAAQQRIQDAGANIARAQAELNNAQNNFTYSGGAGGENQQTTQQQTVGQQTTQQTVEQPVQQQSGSETSITTQDPLKMKVTALEQKESELAKQWEQQDKAAREAFKEYFEAKKSGASQEELDRIEARHVEALKEANRLDKERDAAQAKLEEARRAELQADREAAKAAEPKQQTVEQPVQQQGGGETMTTEQKSAEQAAKDAAVKGAQEKYDQARKDLTHTML